MKEDADLLICEKKSSTYAKSEAEDPTRKKTSEFASQVGRRISEAAEAVGGKRALANLVGVHETQIHRYAKGENLVPLDVLTRIAERCGVRLEWLATGKGPREPGGETPPAPSALEDEFDYVPFLDVEASAGHGAVVEQEQVIQKLAFRKDWLRRHGLNAKRLALLTARGDSMAGTVPDGATVLVERFDPPQEPSTDGIYVLRWDDHLIVKRLARRSDGSIEIISDNPIYGKEHIPRSRVPELNVAGRVAWIGHEI
jgi:phage repressor protein C with HTH and peptisase S24 domain